MLSFARSQRYSIVHLCLHNIKICVWPLVQMHFVKQMLESVLIHGVLRVSPKNNLNPIIISELVSTAQEEIKFRFFLLIQNCRLVDLDIKFIKSTNKKKFAETKERNKKRSETRKSEVGKGRQLLDSVTGKLIGRLTSIKNINFAYIHRHTHAKPHTHSH